MEKKHLYTQTHKIDCVVLAFSFGIIRTMNDNKDFLVAYYYYYNYYKCNIKCYNSFSRKL